ncbi:MAG: DNA-3-methyladenine glycosylase 2 family protein [Chloroflexota bacterium]|nr:DNA-3-methyladenine glycosylase 2 family protein [Chloroflexota bacterium]
MSVPADPVASGESDRVNLRIEPRGPFSLAAARDFLGGFTPGRGTFGTTDDELLMAFPVDGWQGSTAVALRQGSDGALEGVVQGGADLDAVTRQVARVFSVDHDGSAYPAVGERDPVIGALQERFAYLRPVCFYSPYEAAVAAVIGQRISQREAAAMRSGIAREHGERFVIGGAELAAFPLPSRLVELQSYPGLPAEKVERLRAVARAAVSGTLDAEHLRSMPVAGALGELREIRGIGEWSAQHVLLRGAGLADELPLADPLSREAVRRAYRLDQPPDDARFAAIAEAWRPYRMWVNVLLRVWLGREGGPRLARPGRGTARRH